jgi:hypothetical protein
MPATIKDVARLADCSIKTVSRVINNEAHVKESMRVPKSQRAPTGATKILRGLYFNLPGFYATCLRFTHPLIGFNL